MVALPRPEKGGGIRSRPKYGACISEKSLLPQAIGGEHKGDYHLTRVISRPELFSPKAQTSKISTPIGRAVGIVGLYPLTTSTRTARSRQPFRAMKWQFPPAKGKTAHPCCSSFFAVVALARRRRCFTAGSWPFVASVSRAVMVSSQTRPQRLQARRRGAPGNKQSDYYWPHTVCTFFHKLGNPDARHRF